MARVILYVFVALGLSLNIDTVAEAQFVYRSGGNNAEVKFLSIDSQIFYPNLQNGTSTMNLYQVRGRSNFLTFNYRENGAGAVGFFTKYDEGEYYVTFTVANLLTDGDPSNPSLLETDPNFANAAKTKHLRGCEVLANLHMAHGDSVEEGFSIHADSIRYEQSTDPNFFGWSVQRTTGYDTIYGWVDETSKTVSLVAVRNSKGSVSETLGDEVTCGGQLSAARDLDDQIE